MKIVITDADTMGDDIHFGCFAEFGRVVRYDVTPPEKTAERIRDADIVICNKTTMTKQNMSTAENLKYIGLLSTGYNNVDLEYARSRGIIVSNVPGYSTEGVVQHTFALILELFSRVAEYNALVQNGDWKKCKTFSMFPLPISELCGKTIGIIGYGSIGTRVSYVAKAFGMDVLVHTRTPRNVEGVKFVSLDELLSRSDIITIHCPLNGTSEKMINAAAIAKMKNGAVLINTSRGAIIDENAVAAALESGKLGGAGIDVLTLEPMQNDCPLYRTPNCIITPHVSWACVETRQRLLDAVVENLRGFLHGAPQNQV